MRMGINKSKTNEGNVVMEIDFKKEGNRKVEGFKHAAMPLRHASYS